MKDEDHYGMNEDSNLSHSVHASNKEDSQRTKTLTDNKKRDYENEGSSMHEDSCIGINYAHMFSKCFRSLHKLLGFSFCTSCRQFNLSLYQIIEFLTCTRIPCRDSHCVNRSSDVVFSPTVDCSRPPSAINDPIATKKRTKKQIRESRSSEVLPKDRTQRFVPFYYKSLHASSFIDFL